MVFPPKRVKELYRENDEGEGIEKKKDIKAIKRSEKAYVTFIIVCT